MLRQYLYFCTSKASKLSTFVRAFERVDVGSQKLHALLRHGNPQFLRGEGGEGGVSRFTSKLIEAEASMPSCATATLSFLGGGGEGGGVTVY